MSVRSMEQLNMISEPSEHWMVPTVGLKRSLRISSWDKCTLGTRPGTTKGSKPPDASPPEGDQTQELVWLTNG